VKHTVYPPADEVFTWTRMTDIKDVSYTNLSSNRAVRVNRDCHCITDIKILLTG